MLPDMLERYTVDDIPEDGHRYELVDGVLVVTPSPLWGHTRIVSRLQDVLRPTLPTDYWIVAEGGISPGEFDYRIPDVMVVRPGDYRDDQVLGPTAVLLAVEVVSPSSVTTDRITKPAQYAMWGIEGFWRVETDPELSLTAYVLDPGADGYTELGSWHPGETARVTRPFEITFAIDDLAR